MDKTYLSISHGDLAVIRSRRQALAGSLSSRSSNASLLGCLGLLTTASTATAKESTQEVTQLTPLSVVVVVALVVTLGQVGQVVLDTSSTFSAVVGRDVVSVSAAQKVGDHDGGVNRPVTLGPAQSAGFSTADLTIANDGGVGLRTASVA